jgi:hypothetical protein
VWQGMGEMHIYSFLLCDSLLSPRRQRDNVHTRLQGPLRASPRVEEVGGRVKEIDDLTLTIRKDVPLPGRCLATLVSLRLSMSSLSSEPLSSG